MPLTFDPESAGWRCASENICMHPFTWEQRHRGGGVGGCGSGGGGDGSGDKKLISQHTAYTRV